jgi:hypothetical protein
MEKLDDWESIQETLHLSSMPGYVDSVLAASKQDVDALRGLRVGLPRVYPLIIV